MQNLFAILLSLLISFSGLLAGEESLVPASAMESVPVLHQGRFREVSAYAALWWEELYHSTKIPKKERVTLDASSPEEVLWNIHLLGHTHWDSAPIFWVGTESLKDALGLPSKQNRFSYEELKKGIETPRFLQTLIALEFNKTHHTALPGKDADSVELKNVASGLWVKTDGSDLFLIARPDAAPWSALSVGPLTEGIKTSDTNGDSLLERIHAMVRSMRSFEAIKTDPPPIEQNYEAAVNAWSALHYPPNVIAQLSLEQFPLNQRLSAAGMTLKVLPSKRDPGEWYSLAALRLLEYDKNTNSLRPITNFTSYPNALFEEVRTAYLSLQAAALAKDFAKAEEEAQVLGERLRQGYAPLAGKPIRNTQGKTLYYPSFLQLQAEAFYYQQPLVELTLFLYGAAFCSMVIAARTKGRRLETASLTLLATAFLVHTGILALRCYVLNRPPVSNMFETVIYVPWVAVLFSFLLRPFLKSPLLPIASSFTALILLALLKITNGISGMDNVQAVLDSQYWLIIHVMMIVGSYGIFAVSGIMAHIYLTGFLIEKRETLWLKYAASCVLQTLYVGVALLIPGTILGGVWAAQSWGRFWDWDPKESWAFISCCVYLAWIHAYRFGYVSHFGLSLGSVVGLMSISFTWYGVNYLLGTGLHSYGFGSGDNGYYYAYLVGEAAFIALVIGGKKYFLPKNQKTRYE